ncbi:MAG: (2Fe-2S) ferredoxin domain-containing protein [Candidatus Eisenbacteria sp.]|nr:(2Fe-2S) ferredoxin domain-containing protein [Candidatus Eisenbacteria bacterium]
MAKLKLGDLAKIRDQARAVVSLGEGKGRARIIVHMGTCGIASGAKDIMSAFLNEIETRNVADVILSTSGCAGLCSREPMATVELAGEAPVKYADLTPEKASKIFEEHVIGGKIVTECALAIGSERAF